MPVKNPIDCFKKYGVKDLSNQLQKRIEEGANPYEAAREIILAEHRRLHDTVNDIRTVGKLKKEPYIEPKDISQQLKKLKEKPSVSVQMPGEVKKPEIVEPQTTEKQKPIIVYHGTSYDIDKPTIDKYGQVHETGGMLGKAVYFTPSKTEADYFADLSLNKNKGGKKKILEGEISPKKMISVTELLLNAPKDVIDKWVSEGSGKISKSNISSKEIKEYANLPQSEKSLTSWAANIGDISRLAELNGNDAVYWGYEKGKPNEIAIINEDLFQPKIAETTTPTAPQAEAAETTVSKLESSKNTVSGIKLNGSPRKIINDLKGRKGDNAIHAEIFQRNGYNVFIYNNNKILVNKTFKTHEEAKKYLNDWSAENGKDNQEKYDYGTITDIANPPYRQEITGELPKDFIDKNKAVEQPLQEPAKTTVSDAEALPVAYGKAETKVQPEISGKTKVSDSAKQLADKVRSLKINLSKLGDGGLQSNIAGIPAALWNAAIDTIALAIEGGATLAQAVQKAIKKHNLDKQKGFNQKEFISKLEQASGEKLLEEPPPGEPPPTDTGKTDGGETGGKKKSTLNRLYEAKNMPERAKEAFEKEGFEYVPSSQEEAAAIAKVTVDELGIDAAVKEAAAGTFNGGVNAMIFGEALNRLADNENDAGKWAEVAIQWDKYNRVRGQDISAINFFYKHSPLGVVLKENADRKKQFDEWAKGKNQSWEDYFEELKKNPEFAKILDKKIQEDLKKERQSSRAKRLASVRGAFAKAKEKFRKEGGGTYSTIIPPHVIETVLEAMELAYEAGEAVVKIVDDAIKSISKKIGTDNWDKDKFRKEWESALADKGGKAPLTDEELKAKVIDKFKKKLKGLSESQKDEVIRKSYKKIIENGGLDYDEFKEIIGRVTGRGELTDEQRKQLKDMVEKTNAAGEAAKVAQQERTPESLEKFYAAEIEAGRAARDLRDIFRQKPDILRRLTSIMQLSTLGAVSLVANVTYNIWNQLALRYPIGLINDTIDRIWGGIGRMMGKPSVQEYNVWEAQGAFWNKMGQGVKESFEQIGSGLNRQDYTQKELYGQQMRPFKAWRELMAYAKGKRPLTRAEWWDKLIEGTAGIPAELVARFLNVGDKPLRFGAQGAQAKAFTKALGLKDIDEKLFIEFPREEAYRYYKGQGLSDEAAQQKADYVAEAIRKEGERATLQQDNLLNDAITRAAGVLPGGKDSGLASAAKMFVISPYIKIPTNAFWSYYNLVNPEVAIMQSLTYAGLAKKAKNKGDITKSQLLNREARYWMAHAMLGMGLRAVVIAMVQAGMVTPPPDDEESKKERDAMAFFDKPGTIQIGDTKIQTKWFGQLGALSNSIARKYFDATPEHRQNQDEFWNVVWGGMELEALKELENGIFANSSSLFQSISSGDFSRYGINTINLLANIVQPATIAQLNRAALDEVPTSKGDSFLDKLNQNFAQRSTLYRRLFDVDIYKKQDIFGRPIPKGGNLLSRMFGVSKANPQLEMRLLYDDYLRTGDSGFLPSATPTKIGDTKLTMQQQQKLAEYVGEERLRKLRPYISGAAKIPIIEKPYSDLTDEKKKEVVQSIYESGRQKGVEKFYKEYPEFKKPELSPEEQAEKKLLDVGKKLINQ